MGKETTKNGVWGSFNSRRREVILKFKERGVATLHRESDQLEVGTVVFIDNEIRVRWVESSTVEGMTVTYCFRQTVRTKVELDRLLSSL